MLSAARAPTAAPADHERAGGSLAAPGWERWASRALRSLERQIAERTGTSGRRPQRIQAYRGFGNTDEVFVMGRVLAGAAPRATTDADRWWHNLSATFRHLESEEVTGARVHVSMGAAETTAVTDDEGYYRAWLPAPPLSTDRLWHAVETRVDGLDDDSIHTTGHVLVPTTAAEYGVISDIDDTVIRTDATRLLSMLRRTLLENARTRLPFAGVAQFYSALHAGASGQAQNPIFYVSSSPWNLYSVLTEFLEHQGVPLGPLMLRDWGLSEHGILPTRHGEHKLGAIRQILDCYPHLPFILIGDSGQEDPEIYSEVVRLFSGRITAVYIRDVTPGTARSAAIGQLSEEVRAAGSELLLSADTLAGARHAAGQGLLRSEAVGTVADAVRP